MFKQVWLDKDQFAVFITSTQKSKDRLLFINTVLFKIDVLYLNHFAIIFFINIQVFLYWTSGNDSIY